MAQTSFPPRATDLGPGKPPRHKMRSAVSSNYCSHSSKIAVSHPLCDRRGSFLLPAYHVAKVLLHLFDVCVERNNLVPQHARLVQILLRLLGERLPGAIRAFSQHVPCGGRRGYRALPFPLSWRRCLVLLLRPTLRRGCASKVLNNKLLILGESFELFVLRFDRTQLLLKSDVLFLSPRSDYAYRTLAATSSCREASAADPMLCISAFWLCTILLYSTS